MSEQAQAEEKRLTHAESARTMLAAARRGVLSTLESEEGHPYGSLAEFVATDEGDAIFLLSDLAEHTHNFKADARASLFIAPGMADGRPLALERVTLVGEIEPVEDRDAYRDAYLEAHPHAAGYIDFSDFAFWRLRVEKARYIGGFGRMSWVGEEAYRAASPDAIALGSAGAVEHMNDDHTDAILDYVRAFSDIEAPTSARMVALDRYGFDIQAATEDGRERVVRVHFDAPLRGPGQVRKAMVEMVQKARAQLS
ncbi:DUF2470 domain-containing protein [Persicimonas caeni]|uniref:DUF2470 domain-containing protein n=1 Tax=Persicimonas caeni TaxID=2292766 RepID=A0A4Y6PUD5_PERCE|nr:DUF2470 domain-containing protein [Persicimonas caeni]QDG51853.1 DUF2470 domain-containing protein [Persicimonas caeni]QED33074.1 DUF2470 domain-containing protein [Persicimonas caeni]